MTFGFQDVNLCLRKSLVLNSMRIIGCRFKIPKPPQPDSIHNLCWFNAHFAPRIQDTQTQDKLSGGYELKPTVPFSHQQVSKYQVINVVNLIYGNIFWMVLYGCYNLIISQFIPENLIGFVPSVSSQRCAVSSFRRRNSA